MYTPFVSEKFHKLLIDFETLYDDENPIESEEELSSIASAFVDKITFIDNYDEVIECMKDISIRDNAELQMHENEYRDFINLFNDAMQSESWEYLCSNYPVVENDDELDNEN